MAATEGQPGRPDANMPLSLPRDHYRYIVSADPLLWCSGLLVWRPGRATKGRGKEPRESGKDAEERDKRWTVRSSVCVVGVVVLLLEWCCGCSGGVVGLVLVLYE